MNDLFRVRPGTFADIHEAWEIERASFAGEGDSWTLDTLVEFLGGGDTELWVVESPYYGVVAAMYLTVDEYFTYVCSIATLPDFRRQGHALRLIKEAEFHAAKNSLRGVKLEVRESNVAARSLYEKRGYEATRKLKKYYTDEDGLRMVRTMESIEKGV